MRTVDVAALTGSLALTEPIARRLGRSSAERTLEEFRSAVVRMHGTDR